MFSVVIILDVETFRCGMPIDHYNACEAFARGQLQRSTCRILTQMGFTHANDSSLDLITDITRRYMQTMCTTVKWVAEHCGRTNVTLGDMEFVYDKMNISVNEMNLYIKQVRPMSPRIVPRFPASPPSVSNSTPLAKKARPSHIPDWAPPGPDDNPSICQIPISKSSSDQVATRPSLPDFTNHTARSLGLCKVKSNNDLYQQNVAVSYKNKPLSRQPSLTSVSRPPSRSDSRTSIREGSLGRNSPLPSAATIAELESLSVQISSQSGTPLVSPEERPDSRASNQPIFKRRIGKRKSQDDVATPIVLSCIKEQSEAVSNRKDVLLKGTGTKNPPKQRHDNKKNGDKSFGTLPSGSRSTVNLLTLGSDLAREPRAVVSAALSGRSAVSHNEHLLPVPPFSRLNIRGPPTLNETPNQVVQASILRSLFTPDSNVQREVQEALRFASIIPTRHAPAHSDIRTPEAPAYSRQSPQVSRTLLSTSNQNSGSPATHMVTQSSANNSPAYEIVQHTEAVEKSGSLKIRLRRSSFGLNSVDSPQRERANLVDVSEDTMDLSHSNKKKKKRKKEKKRSRDAVLPGANSPICVQDGGGLKIKIKFGGPRP